MATKKPEENDTALPFPVLQLLAPPVRLVSAALWKVMKQRDVMQYGTVEEFVTSACDTVPGLLTYRHQGKLALGLRARLILELCRGQDQPDPKVIRPHLQRICSPTPSSTSGCKPKRDIKIDKTVSSFQELVQTLLRDPAERGCFFKEEFPVDYGPQFDQELEKLLWEFLMRLDQLLPVPNLAQTVSWLSAAPPVVEECARAATQPQLLKILLQHQSCLGHLDSAASLPPGMGDSILTSLSLPPSGRVPSILPSEHPKTSSPEKSGVSAPAPETVGHSRTRDASPFIMPVIGLMSNEDVPIMSLANERRTKGTREVEGEVAEKERTARNGSRMKRKRPDEGETELEEVDTEVVRLTRSGRKSAGSGAGPRVQRRKGSEEDGTNGSARDDESEREVLRSCMARLGLQGLKLPENPSLRPILTSCLLSQPRILVARHPVTSTSGAVLPMIPTVSYGNCECREEKAPSGLDAGRRAWPVLPRAQRKQDSNPVRPEVELPGVADKENRAALSEESRSSSCQSTSTGDGEEDIIVDSEDEGTKNFKGRLFMKRYYKTKHNTYIPTLREFWKPGMARRDLLSPGNGHR